MRRDIRWDRKLRLRPITQALSARTLLIVAGLWVGVAWQPVTAQEKKTPSFKTVYRDNQVVLQDADGKDAFWIDGWGRVHSPVLSAQQDEYNAYVHRSFRGFIMGGLSAPEGIELSSSQPPGQRGIKESNVFQVPYHIRTNGVMTRDTLSLSFYKRGMEWNYKAHYLAADCDEARRVFDPSADYNRYKINWTNEPAGLQSTSTAEDPFLLKSRCVALWKARKALRGWQSLLESIPTRTSQGLVADAARDEEQRETRMKQCVGMSLVNNCNAEAEDFTFPADWLTAQVDASKLTPEFLKQLEQAQHEVESCLDAPELKGELRPDFYRVKWADEELQAAEKRLKIWSEEGP